MRLPRLILVFAVFFAFAAAPLVSARPQVLVALADGLTLQDAAPLRAGGAWALMSPGLAHPPDPVATVYATLGAGDSIGVGDVSQGRLAESLRRAGVRAALLGDASGDDTKPYLPARLLLPAPDVVGDGAVPDPLAPGGKREDPARLWAATQKAFGSCDLVVVHFGDFARAEREPRHGIFARSMYAAYRRRALAALRDYLSRARAGHSGPIFLVVPTPPALPDGSWDRLSPVVAWNTGAAESPFSSLSLSLSSATTQTAGLVAARDVAPTLLAALQVPAPLQMTGAAFVSADVSPAALARMDRLVRLNQEAQNPLFWTVGLGAATIVFSCLGLFLTGRMHGRTGSAACYGLRLIAAWPLALLAAPLVPVSSAGAYLAVIAGFVALLALLPSPAHIFALTAIVLVGDGLTGTRLIAGSALSEYALSGIRFYGIGNEYMGVLIGGALLACLIAPSVRDLGFALWFASVVFVLSFPAFGAKAGGAVTATATFVVAWLRLTGRPVRWTHLVGSVVIGFVLVFVWAALGHTLHLRRTHLDTATEALRDGRLGYIWGVSVRKLGLAARVLLHPGTLLGLLAFAGLAWAGRKLFWRQVSKLLTQNPALEAVGGAGLWGCLVAVLFNDSGIVAAILIGQCLALALLHCLFQGVSQEGFEENAFAES